MPQRTLGNYDTPEQASAVVEHFLKEHHGEFYRSHDLSAGNEPT